MAEAAGLSRDFPSFNEILIAVHSSFNSAEGIVNRVHTEQSVTGAVREAFAVRNLHTFDIVGRMVRLKTEGKSVRCTAGGVAGSVNRKFSCADHKVKRGHKLGNGSNALRVKTSGNSSDLITGYMVIKDEFTKLSHGPVLDFIIDAEVDVVLDKTGNIIFFIRTYGVLVDILNGKLCKAFFCSDTLLHSFGSDSSELVTGFKFCRFVHDVFNVFELVDLSK